MPLYTYRAVDSYGKSHEGQMDEVSARHVTEALTGQGLQVSQVSRIGGGVGLPRLARGFSWHDIEILNSQLHAAAKAGMPLTSALESVAREMRQPARRSALEAIKQDIEGGATLHEAFQRRADMFPPLYLSVIRAGEVSGNLPGVLEMMTRHVRRAVELRNSLHEAFAYPTVLMVAILATMVFLTGHVVPMYRDVFMDFDARLPGVTLAVLAIGDAIKTPPIFLLLVAALIALVMLTIAMPRLAGNVEGFDRLRLHVPLIGRMVRTSITARFCRALGIALGSGVPVLDALSLAAAAGNSAVLRMRVRKSVQSVAAGTPISDAIDSTHFFSHTVSWMLSTSEQRGDLERTLLDIADHAERDLGRMDRYIVAYLAPLLVVLMGVIVGVVVWALYLPLFSLADSLSG